MKIKMDKSLARSRVEQDYELIENEGLFEEYLEMGLYPLFYFCHFSKFACSGFLFQYTVKCADGKIFMFEKSIFEWYSKKNVEFLL